LNIKTTVTVTVHKTSVSLYIWIIKKNTNAQTENICIYDT